MFYDRDLIADRLFLLTTFILPRLGLFYQIAIVPTTNLELARMCNLIDVTR